MRFSLVLPLICLTLGITASPLGGQDVTKTIRPYRRAALQDIVTWDAYSLFIHGERVVIYSGEFHPFRLPVPSLWLDVFQKIKSLGYNAASIYWDWALLEGQQGYYNASGVLDVALFLETAKSAGVYIIARPGPYINAEVSGGGFPGWLQRNPAHLRTNDSGYLDATDNYVSNIGKTIADAQITNGGAVILVQPENEYLNGFATGFSPNPYYIQDVEDQWRNAGIVMPFTDNYGGDYFQPGSGIGAIDLYGSDSYPQGFVCSDPYNWNSDDVVTNYYSMLESQSNTTPPMIPEFQGGSFDPWGGSGFANCAILTNEDFEKVYYKNNFASGLKIVSYYMTFGGTNWGNLGYPVGYTSYDYGAAITENREVAMAKYSEAKLIANFWQASPAYLTASPYPAETNQYTTQTDLSVTPLFDSESKTGFWVIRHDGSETQTTYNLILPTSNGTIEIPQIQGNLTLVTKDSKIHVTDYAVGSYNVLYSSAEVFTHQTYSTYSVAILYGGFGETHELAFSDAPTATVVSGSGVTIDEINGATVLNWQVSSSRIIVQIGPDLYVYLIDRNSAYNYWVSYLPGNSTDPFGTFSTSNPVITNGGYLVRNTTLSGDSLYVTGDVNSTTTVEVIGVPSSVSSLYFNGVQVDTTSSAAPILSGQVTYTDPGITLPNLADLDWKYIDSLPELGDSYDDSLWTVADLTSTNNTYYSSLSTPVSLYASDYGYNTGSLVYRGHFTATGTPNANLTMTLVGGEAFSASIWLNSTFLGSFTGEAPYSNWGVSFEFPDTTTGNSYVLNVLIDQTGFEESQTQGADLMKAPRGILSYDLGGLSSESAVSWKLTGNLHGESFEDKTRGPLNEGGLYAERQGYHLPDPPSSSWTSSSPFTGTTAPGVAFYSSTLNLSLPTGYDVPLYFNFPPPANGSNFRTQLYVNGWQFGKYIHNIGPQTAFPVPEGILNYQGTNTIALSLWSQDANGNALESLNLTSSTPVQSGFGVVTLVDSPAYSPRAGAY